MTGSPTSRIGFLCVVAALFLIGLAQVAHRHFSLGVPLVPSASRDVWFVDAKIEFDAQGGPITASLALPGTQLGYTLLRENLVSPGYGIAMLEENDMRRAEWTIAQAEGHQSLYYKAQLAADNVAVSIPVINGTAPQAINLPTLDEASVEAAAQIVGEATKKSAGPLSLTRQVLGILTQDPPDQRVELLRSTLDSSQLLLTLLAQASVSARPVSGLELEDGRRRQRLKSYVEIFDKEKWHLFDPRTGTEGQPDNVFIWAPGASSILDVVGGEDSDLTFSLLRQEESALKSVLTQLDDFGQDSFSIYRLPLEEQSLLKGMFLIPIGALVVVFMRIMVGIRTSGTFMPVLLAVAFIQTELLPGLFGFVLIVGTGLFVRSYLSHINLLLVARISATLIVVIGLTILFTLLSESLGLESVQHFSFFPLIIMAWTVERMSILWEEEGAREVLIQSSGSLLVAVLAFTLMATPLVRHLSFNFLGLQLVFLSLILLMGQYTGYRLLELMRFKPLQEDDA